LLSLKHIATYIQMQRQLLQSCSGDFCLHTPVPWSRNVSRERVTRCPAARQSAQTETASSQPNVSLFSRREGLLQGLCWTAAAVLATPPAFAAALSQPDIEQLEVRPLQLM
jgi:hypothetical protein